MRLLLTSDLHRDGAKLLWLLEEASPYDALLIGGDLLDLFSNTAFAEQTSGALRSRQAIIESGKSIAWCSGNHDFFFGAHTPLSAASPRWMCETPSTATCISDGETRLLEAGGAQIAITTLPWLGHGSRKSAESLLTHGKRMRIEKGVPWVVLCHEPPGGTPLCPTYTAPEADFARRLIEEAEPDFSLHGHIHAASMTPGGSWICRIGRTICFNAGQSPAGEPLHYISLELHGLGVWSAEWHGDGRVEKFEASKDL